MKNPVFSGACTALVTPFLNNQVNYPMLQQLISYQEQNGINAIVLAGTTGEAPTLTDGEKLELFTKGKEYASDGCKIIAGTGSNNTAHTVRLSRAAQEAGADALLVVAPYYNKGNASGIYEHFAAVAEAVSIPVILYNVPGRTGVDIPVNIYRELSKIPNIYGVKEASTDIVKIAKIRNECPDDFYVWSGNDDQTVPAMSLGAVGVISVLSNILPRETAMMANAAFAGDFLTASTLQRKLLPLINALFREANPIPVKYAMKFTGFDCGPCRLPLGEPEDNTKALLERLLRQKTF